MTDRAFNGDIRDHLATRHAETKRRRPGEGGQEHAGETSPRGSPGPGASARAQEQQRMQHSGHAMSAASPSMLPIKTSAIRRKSKPRGLRMPRGLRKCSSPAASASLSHSRQKARSVARPANSPRPYSYYGDLNPSDPVDDARYTERSLYLNLIGQVSTGAGVDPEDIAAYRRARMPSASPPRCGATGTVPSALTIAGKPHEAR